MITINITAENIVKGKTKCNRSCPIALTFNEGKGVKRVAHASVYDTHSTLFLKKKIKGKTITLDFLHSNQITNFINKFDSGKKVNPQTITFSKKLLKRKRLL
jgi:hypothetical protein